MKFRIFYAPQEYKTWEKLFVLTSDGKLYCEYLMRFNLKTIEKEGVSYATFRASDYAWGKGVVGDRGMAFENYQGCEKELSWNDYENLTPSALLNKYDTSVNAQIRWVENYLIRLGLNKKDWDASFIKE